MPIETIKDPRIVIKPGPELIEFALKHVSDGNMASNGVRSLRSATKKQRANVTLGLEDLRWLDKHVKEYRKRQDDRFHLHELLRTCIIDLPKPEITPRNPELEARVQKLIAEQNARDYRAMTKGVDSVRKHHPEDTIAYQMREMNRQLIAVAQFVFSVFAGFLFGFTGVELIIGNLDFGLRLLLGIIIALVIALAEIYFLAKKLNEADMDVPPPGRIVHAKMHQE